MRRPELVAQLRRDLQKKARIGLIALFKNKGPVAVIAGHGLRPRFAVFAKASLNASLQFGGVPSL